MPKSLEMLLNAASPRYSRPPTPLRSYLIHGGVLFLWLGLFLMAFRFNGVLAWSTGLVYVAYDSLLLVFVFWQTLRLTKTFDASMRAQAVACDGNPYQISGATAAASQAPALMLTLGVIVAAHNEAGVLPVTLAALLAQNSPPDVIVIADDGSADETPALLLRLYALAAPELGQMSTASPTHPGLYWLRLPHGGKAAALNSAIVKMQTDIVLTVDGDTLLEPGALAAMRAAFASEPALVAATGVLAPVCDASLSGRLFQWFQTYEYIRNFLSRYAWMQVGGLLLISGAFAGFRRQAVLDVGGFDADCLVEDYELIHRLRRHSALSSLGWTTRVLGGARARTEAPGGVTAFLRQRRRWFGGFLQTQYWYRDMVGDPRYGWLGTAMLPVKAIDTLQPLYGLTAFFLLLYYLFGYVVDGRSAVLGPVAFVIAGKIVLDLAFHLWSVHLYRCWAESPAGEVHHAPRASLGLAFLAAIAEPFTFQILRHTGAAWGWLYFLTGQRKWCKQSRGGLRAP